MRILRVFALGLALLVVSSGLIGCRSPQGQAQEAEKVAVHTCVIDGLTVQTGDLICTTAGGRSLFAGLLWHVGGIVIPGPVDHIAVYVGPGGRCVEAGPRGVITFDVPGNTWDDAQMAKARSQLRDTLYGVAYPLAGRPLSRDEEAGIRREVAQYCLRQAQAGKPYNLVFPDSMTDKAFYCSQLAYKAYLEHRIDLNTGQGVPDIPGTKSIICPQEIWAGCAHERAPEPSPARAKRVP